MILKFTLVLRKKAKAQFMCFFLGVSLLAFWKHICVFSENSGFSTQIIHFHRDFHYKSSILGVSPLFLKTPKIWEPPGAEKQKRKTPVCSSRLWRRTNQKQLGSIEKCAARESSGVKENSLRIPYSSTPPDIFRGQKTGWQLDTPMIIWRILRVA